jgi:hypothetical protein
MIHDSCFVAFSLRIVNQLVMIIDITKLFKVFDLFVYDVCSSGIRARYLVAALVGSHGGL